MSTYKNDVRLHQREHIISTDRGSMEFTFFDVDI